MGTPAITPDSGVVATFAAAVASLRASALAGRSGVAHARAMADAYDGLVIPHANACFATAGKGRAALFAAGGYGRGALSPGSDLDLVLVVDDPGQRWVPELTEALLYPLWDAKLSVGHTVQSVGGLVALARDDVRTRTMVLDVRFLAGDTGLADRLREASAALRGERELTSFIEALRGELCERHARFGETVYLLEPDVKLGRGGLRDLDVLRWALRARFRTPDFAEALGLGGLTQSEHDALREAREFHFRLRGAMHARAGRRSDRLTFDVQEDCAQALGFLDDAEHASDPAQAVAAAAERLMSTYYGHARRVASSLAHVLARCVPTRPPEHVRRPQALADGVARFDGTACLATADAAQRDPSVALRLVELAMERDLPVADSSRATLAAAAADPAWCERLRASSEAARCFVRMLEHGRAWRASGTAGSRSVLADLHDLGLLLAMIPEFAAVTGRVQHDVYHVYTVDVHSVAAVDRLHAIGRGELGAEFALAARIMAGLDRRPVLLLATLLHDVGKSHGRSHSRVGAEMTPSIAARLGFDAADAEDAAWLVQEHLTLYHLATRRDLSDPATLAQVTSLVGDRWRLQALFLLTVADLSTTSPTAMTAWKARLLDDLYATASSTLSGAAADHGRQRDALVARVAAIDATCAGWAGAMPVRYLRATAPRDVVRHARALSGVPVGGVRVVLHPVDDAGASGLFEVLVSAQDRAGLLADLTGLLFAHRLDIQRAEIHSVGERVVDVFVVRHPDPASREIATLPARLSAQLAAASARDLDVPALVAMTRGRVGAPRAEPSVASRVALHDDASDDATVVEMFGRDRPGFLHTVAEVHHRLGLEIRVAKVNTEGRRAADVFYVTEAAGGKLAPERFDEVRAALLDATGAA